MKPTRIGQNKQTVKEEPKEKNKKYADTETNIPTHRKLMKINSEIITYKQIICTVKRKRQKHCKTKKASKNTIRLFCVGHLC